tara:strand:+ start:1352 stop:1828 length:477 start_codon:yes stop_codon:yes gene_type:complete
MRQKGCDCISLQKIEVMKLLVGAFIVCLFVSCGKYEKPFISFKSPEKRLTQNTWRCVQAVDESGNEYEVFDQVEYSIDGSDSTFFRISNVGHMTSNWSGTNDTTVGTWTWDFALEGKFNKQQIIHSFPERVFRVVSLSNKILVLRDETSNVSYNYERL